MEFLQRRLRAVGKTVHRLGLATKFGLDERGIREAFARGINYVFWNPGSGRLTKVLRSLPPSERDKLVIATGPTLGFLRGSVRRRTEKVLRLLGTDTLDVLQLYWVGRTSIYSDSIVEEMVKLRAEGKVRALGVSIHDRKRAGELALDSPLDLLMIRYNAAHPGAEREVFPHLHARQPSIVAYTATRWGKLLKAPHGFDGRPATAGDCYRFCLSNPHVDVVLCGPRTAEELRENLDALEKGPLGEAEMAHMRALGQAVHDSLSSIGFR